MQAESTLKRVFLRLFARVLIQGNPDHENDGITPSCYSYTYNQAPTGEQTVAFTSTQDDSGEQVTVSAPGFSNATINVENLVNKNTSTSGEIRVIINGRTYTIPNYTVSSSDRSILDSFRANNASNYNISVKSGCKLSDTVSLTTSSYTGTFTVRELLSGQRLNLQ